MATDSNDTSGVESQFPEPSIADVSAMIRLSENLESIFKSDFDFYSDARIIVADGRVVPVHRCILSARSPFFKRLFSGKEKGVKFELKELLKNFDVGFDSLSTVLTYVYSGKLKSFSDGPCVCVDDECPHIACRPVVDFLTEILYASFTFEIVELVALCQRHLLDILPNATIDDVLVILSVADFCSKSCNTLLAACTDITVRSDVDIVTLERSLPYHIVKQITDMRKETGLQDPETIDFPNKHIKRIHRALDSDDVELVRMLLKEEHTTIDDSCALHYAVAYCDAKTTTDLLDLSIADVNHRNARGYTVLHIAAMRKDPKIIVSLLTKGARPSDLTSDGRKSLTISKRLTRASDYYKSIEEGKGSPKDRADRLCIEILEQAERRDPLLGEASVSLAMAGDDLRMKLLYLENRVGLAKLLFPMEAKVAMDIAQVDGTCEFPVSGINFKHTDDAQRKTVDLNEAPFRIKEEHLNRLRALSRTVELGKRFFPRCSEVLNKIMDADDLSELAYLGKDTPEERQVKKQRYIELQQDLNKAFSEDKEEFKKSNILSSSSSSLSATVSTNHDHNVNGKRIFKTL